MSRVSPGTMIVVIFAILFGLVGAYAVRKHLEKPEEPAPPPPVVQRTTVPMAATDLEPGREMTLDDIVVVRLTAKEMKEQGLDGQFMTNTRHIIGRVLREPKKKGETFITGNLYPQGMGPGIADRLKPGQRAVTIPVEGIGLVKGFAWAGSYVDILFRTNADEAKEIPQTTVHLLEGVEVLALEKNTVPNSKMGTELRDATLAVTPEQANALKTVEGHGVFTLSLRNPNDVEVNVATGPTTLESLLNLPRPQSLKTTIYRGGSVTTMEFSEADAAPQLVASHLPVPGLPLNPRKSEPKVFTAAEDAGTSSAEQKAP